MRVTAHYGAGDMKKDVVVNAKKQRSDIKMRAKRTRRCYAMTICVMIRQHIHTTPRIKTPRSGILLPARSCEARRICTKHAAEVMPHIHLRCRQRTLFLLMRDDEASFTDAFYAARGTQHICARCRARHVAARET